MTDVNLLESELAVEILQTIKEKDDGCSPTEIGEELGKPRANVSNYMGRMKELGLLSYERKRSSYYTITPKGEEFLDRIIDLEEEKEKLQDWLHQ